MEWLTLPITLSLIHISFRDGGDWVSPERLAPVLAWLDGD